VEPTLTRHPETADERPEFAEVGWLDGDGGEQEAAVLGFVHEHMLLHCHPVGEAGILPAQFVAVMPATKLGHRAVIEVKADDVSDHVSYGCFPGYAAMSKT
jgi:hypothetical protein